MSALSPRDELALLLRPAGGGVYLVSSGRAEQEALQRRWYRAEGEDEVRRRFETSLERVSGARVVVLAVPSDVGAGFVRGANLGPQALRAGLLERWPDWPERAEAAGVVDVGDVFVVPQLLHDEMLSPAQLRRSRRALYPRARPEVAEGLPVSPLSIAERALELVFSLNPQVKAVALGGDHSTALPLARALGRVRKDLGIVQVDAHTDLLEERLGVPYCFGTWSFHANELVGRRGRLVQVGIRASTKDRAHWESRYDVRQFWSEAVRKDPAAALDAIVAQLRASQAQCCYFSNDIDGTDEAFVNATGTPEPLGLEPDFVVELIRRLGRETNLCAADVMEIAPLVQRTPDGAQKTVALGVRYLVESLQALLGQPL